MKDASSIPPDFNPNYEERRKRLVPAKQRKGQPAPQKHQADGDGQLAPKEHSPDPQRKEDCDAASGNKRIIPDSK